MEKINRETPDIIQENIDKIAELFPQVMTEIENSDGNLEHAIDFDALRDLLGDVAEGQRERYQFTWPGKREAKAEARRTINKTMRPIKEDSVNWDSTENLYIEGDNLDALKILRETYAGKVKLIYIDPPYNTGNDFIYDDDYAVTKAEYSEENGDYDGERGRLVTNLESNGRFHSDWCSMMYPRLLLAKDLLASNGVLFISIDDHENMNLKKLADEIFGESHHVATFLWKKTNTPGSLSYKNRKTVEYVFAYEPTKTKTKYFGNMLENQDNPLLKNSNSLKTVIFPPNSVHFNFIKEGTLHSGKYPNGDILKEVTIKNHVNTNNLVFKCHSTWQQSTIEEEINEGTYFIAKTRNMALRFQRVGNSGYKPPNNYLDSTKKLDSSIGVGTNESATTELEKLHLKNIMSYPKPTSLMKYLVNMVCKFDNDAVILDFFSGSASTAHAIMQQNAEDNGARKFIMIQLPEATDSDSEAAKKGFENICEIGKERIRRAGKKIAEEIEEHNNNLNLYDKPKEIPDIGFRVFKIDSSNIGDVKTTPEETTQDKLFDLANNIKPDRNSLDLLFEVLPSFRIPYSAKIEEKEVTGKKCYFVNDNQLIACFDENVETNTIEEIAKMQPLYAVMRDSSMIDDATFANFEELFKTYSPDTVRRVI